MTICVIVNCLIVSTLNYQQKCQLLKPASFSKKYLSTIHMHWLWREREGERERMDKKTNLNANSLPRKDAWPPAHHSTDFSDWEIVKRKKDFLQLSLGFWCWWCWGGGSWWWWWRWLHTWYLSREPWEFSCKFFLAGVNFYRFNAKNWHFRQFLREKLSFFLHG